jgi:hypothetical protein
MVNGLHNQRSRISASICCAAAAPVAVGVFHLHGQLGKGLAEFGDEHHGVEPKAVAAARLGA